MTDKNTKPEAADDNKAKAAKKPATAKAPAKAASAQTAPKAAAKPAEKKAAAPKSGKTITLTQTGSPIGRQEYQRATLIGLGLNKLHRTRTLVDSPEVRGMINKVRHLIKVAE